MSADRYAIVYFYTMLYKHGERMHDYFGRFYFYSSLVFYTFKTIIPLALVGYEMTIANALSWKFC